MKLGASFLATVAYNRVRSWGAVRLTSYDFRLLGMTEWPFSVSGLDGLLMARVMPDVILNASDREQTLGAIHPGFKQTNGQRISAVGRFGSLAVGLMLT